MSTFSQPALLVRITLLLFDIQPSLTVHWETYFGFEVNEVKISLALVSTCSVFELISLHVSPSCFQSRVCGRAQFCALLIPDNALLLFMSLVGMHRSRILLTADVKNCHHPIIAGQSTLDWRVATSPDSFKILLERNIRVPDWHLNSTQWRATRMAGVFQESVA
jgi:hypothetical protein